MSITDKNGNAVQLSYDGSGSLVTVTFPGGRSLSLAHDANGRITKVTDPLGRTQTYSYDGSNNLATATDSLGGVTTYAYDANHHLTQITLPNGNTLLQNAYDAYGRVVSQTNGRGFTSQFAYNTPTTGQTTITDALGNATIHTYDSSLSSPRRS
jgi:YD repeat-containing protein